MENKTELLGELGGGRGKDFQVWTVRSRADVMMKTTPEAEAEGREDSGPEVKRESLGKGTPSHQHRHRAG